MSRKRWRGLASGTTLRSRILRAGGWSVGQLVVNQAFRLVSNLIMTRLLLPEAFGLMAVVTTLLTAFGLLSDIGIHRSVVREPDGADPHFLRAAWTVKVWRGTVIAAGVVVTAGLAWAIAPVLAAPGTVYADPRLPGLILLSALAPLFQGLEAINKELSQRNLQLQYFTLVSLAAQVTALVAMVILAQISPTVWALTFGMLVASIVNAALSHVVYPGPRMRFVRDPEVTRRLWTYGKFLMGSSAFTFVASFADRFILAALVDAATFGLYFIAQLWAGAGRLFISRLSDQVGFPAIGEVIRERPDEVPRLFARFQRVIDVICLAAFLGTLLLGQWLIDLLYTSDYALAGHYLRLLSVGFLVMRFDTMNQLIMNLGNSRAIMWISAMRAVALCVLLSLGFALFGMDGAVVAVALTPGVTFPYTYVLVRPVLGPAQSRAALVWFGATLVISAVVILAPGG